MTGLCSKYTRKTIALGAVFCMVSLAAAIHSMEAEVLLSPPGLRPIKEPFLVIPADYNYRNRSIQLPTYRDPSGNPASGWSARFVDTRRFASDQSAWVFYRHSDFQQSVTRRSEAGRLVFRFWPVGTTLIIETYKGNAFVKENAKLIEIAAMSKINANENSVSKGLYPINWTYAEFMPDGNPSITSAKVHECHQCHSIAFHLTGDLVFTVFP